MRKKVFLFAFIRHIVYIDKSKEEFFMNDLIVDYICEHDLLPEEITWKDIIKITLSAFVQEENKDLEIETFLKSIFCPHPEEEIMYWVMVNNNTDNLNLAYKDLDKLILDLSYLANEHYNIYYSPALFTGWRTDENVRYVSTIFVDIDDVNHTDFSDMQKNEVKNWLLSTYPITEEQLPNWCVCSGHGLHLYYLVEELDLKNETDLELRDRYTDYLIAFFSSDIACRNKSRILRVPNSINIKKEPKKTNIYQFNTDDNRSIKRLDCFCNTSEYITEYMENAKNERTKKRLATLKAKGKINLDKKKRKGKALTKSKQNLSNHTADLSKLKYETTFSPHSRYWNMIKDLNNYFVRHNGAIDGCRELFIHILTCFLKRVMPYEKAKTYIKKYMSEDFEKEGMSAFDTTFFNATNYHYRNTTIAELLQFTDADIKQSYCNFSEERIQQAKKNTQNNQAKKRKEQRNTAEKKQLMYEDVKLHYHDMSVVDLAIIWDVSTRTINRIKKRIREEE